MRSSIEFFYFSPDKNILSVQVVPIYLLSLSILCVTRLYVPSADEEIKLVLDSGNGEVFPGHILVTGGAGYIGSHAALLLLERGFAVTIFDNFSRGNLGAIYKLQQIAPPTKLRIIEGDLASHQDLHIAFSQYRVDAVMHFAAIAYVGESVLSPLKYYRNVTSNTVALLEYMSMFGVNKLIYSSTCATYGNPAVLPLTEETPTLPINPYGRSKLFAELAIRDFAAAHADFKAIILRYFNVIGSDPLGRLGEYPRPELRKLGRLSGACFDAALGQIDKLVIAGNDYPTHDGTCVRDYIHVSDLVEAHVASLNHLQNPPVI